MTSLLDLRKSTWSILVVYVLCSYTVAQDGKSYTFFKPERRVASIEVSAAQVKAINRSEEFTRETSMGGVVGALFECGPNIDEAHVTPGGMISGIKPEWVHIGDLVEYSVVIYNPCSVPIDVPIAVDTQRLKPGDASYRSYQIELESNDPQFFSVGETNLYGSREVPGTTVKLQQNEFVSVKTYGRIRYKPIPEYPNEAKPFLAAREVGWRARVYMLRSGVAGWYPTWSFQEPVHLNVQPGN